MVRSFKKRPFNDVWATSNLTRHYTESTRLPSGRSGRVPGTPTQAEAPVIHRAPYDRCNLEREGTSPALEGARGFIPPVLGNTMNRCSTTHRGSRYESPFRLLRTRLGRLVSVCACHKQAGGNPSRNDLVHPEARAFQQFVPLSHRAFDAPRRVKHSLVHQLRERRLSPGRNHEFNQ